MDDSKFNKYKTVSEIIKKASDEVIKLCHEKNGINYICGYSDNLIKNELSNSCSYFTTHDGSLNLSLSLKHQS